MNSRILKILFVIIVTCVFASCGSFTPPVAGPNQTPVPSLDQGSNLEPLPLEAMPTYDESGDEIQAEIDLTDPSVTADPSTIYTLDLTDGIITNQTSSKIVVEAGTFESNIEVSVYGIVDDPEGVTSPPYIVGTDLNSDEEYVQLTTDADGGLEFILAAGHSPGQFVIMISDGEQIEYVIVTIEGPDEI